MASRKYIVAGGLAGVCMSVMVMLCVILILYTGVFWQYLFNSQIPIIQDTAWLAVMQDMSRLPSFIWGWRWIIVGSTLGGALLALMQSIFQRLAPAWRERVLRLIVFGSISGFVIARMLISQAESVFRVSNAAERLSMLAQQQSSVWSNLMLISIAGLVVAGILWMGWSWWYGRWWRWLTPKAQGYIDAPEVSSEQWFNKREAYNKARRLLLLLLPVSLLLVFGAATLYERTQAEILSGELWVDPTTPTAAVVLPLTASSRNVFVENTYGTGKARVSLLDANNTLQAEPVVLTFQNNQVSYERTEIAVSDLKQGSYQLTAKLQEGSNARIGYALIQGDKQPMILSATLLGICTGVVLALLVVLLGERVQKLSGE